MEPVTVNEQSSNHRNIRTAIPAPGTSEVINRLQNVESRSMHGQLPIVWKNAVDFNVYDIADNKFIDFTSSIFIANVGHSNQKVSSAIKSSLDDNLYSCYAYASTVRAEYMEKLLDFGKPYFEKSFLLSAGTEATEAVFKLIRMAGQKNGKRRLGIVTFENNWHGRTLGAQMLSSNIKQKDWVGYQDKDVHHLPFPYPWDLQNLSGEEFFEKSLQKFEKNNIKPKEDLAGFVLETFQGWGALFYPKGFVKTVKRFCDDHGLILAFDEMQAGFGRTGKNFGFEHYQVKPDLVAVGKGMGGGVPLSGVLGRADLMDLPDVGNMSSTHSANPLVCKAGIAVLNELNSRNLVYESQRKGIIMHSMMSKLHEKFPDIVSIPYGKGLIAAQMFFKKEDGSPNSKLASRVCEISMRSGILLVHTGRESIKFGPPLTITDDALIEGMEIYCRSVETAIKS